MSSHARSSREEERRISVRTLIIASIASALAAIITSHFWTSGTPIAAALTPVIVTLVSELLHRPTQRIAERLTTETAALRAETAALRTQTDVLPEAAGAGPPPPREEHDPRPAREPPPVDPRLERPGRPNEREVRIYRATATTPRLRWKPILVTAGIAFAIAAAALTLPELIAGESVGKGDRNFTLFGGGSSKKKTVAPETGTQETDPAQEVTRPDQTVPELQPDAEETALPRPEETQTAPRETQTQTAPAPRSQSTVP